MRDLLAAAVAAVNGSPREGQQQMADAVAEAMTSGVHLLVQAGTGTGKSLAYLVPAIAHAVRGQRCVVVSTATLALQSQIVERDLPRLADALTPLLGRRPTWQVVKGRANYVCLHKLDGGYPEEDGGLFSLAPATAGAGGSLAEPAPGRLGSQVVRLREWAQATPAGEREELVPGVSDQAWRQVSVSARECLGTACPRVTECFCDTARERARSVDIVVTNHAVVAIDAFEGRSLLPEHDVLVVDEAHELADRVTSVVSKELTVTAVEIAARRCRAVGVATTELDQAAVRLADAFQGAPEGRITDLAQHDDDPLGASVIAVRDGARALVSAVESTRSGGPGAGEAARALARAAIGEVFDVAERLASGSGGRGGADVVWLSRVGRPEAGGVRITLHVAPLTVAGALRGRVFDERTVIATSATLSVGGSFEAVARSFGLGRAEGLSAGTAPGTETGAAAGTDSGSDSASDPRTDSASDSGSHSGSDGRNGAAREPAAWTGLDVGSPFDYPRQAILYIARHLPAPGRDGLGEPLLEELAGLVEAAGGRTLGLFSSRRAAQTAAEQLRERLDVPILCQGDDLTPILVRAFADDERTCLFGTLSLWQGVDVPGSSCQLVVVDRIPFPRPDDPLGTARQEAVARRGGNAFMSVAATHAALLLAQGVGRLVRSTADRGVVAVLDSRLATARYAGFLRASLPPFWTTTDRDVVLAALRRIDQPVGG